MYGQLYNFHWHIFFSLFSCFLRLELGGSFAMECPNCAKRYTHPNSYTRQMKYFLSNQIVRHFQILTFSLYSFLDWIWNISKTHTHTHTQTTRHVKFECIAVEPKFACSDCGCRFRRKSYLRDHSCQVGRSSCFLSRSFLHPPVVEIMVLIDESWQTALLSASC